MICFLNLLPGWKFAQGECDSETRELLRWKGRRRHLHCGHAPPRLLRRQSGWSRASRTSAASCARTGIQKNNCFTVTATFESPLSLLANKHWSWPKILLEWVLNFKIKFMYLGNFQVSDSGQSHNIKLQATLLAEQNWTEILLDDIQEIAPWPRLPVGMGWEKAALKTKKGRKDLHNGAKFHSFLWGAMPSGRKQNKREIR